MSVSLDEQYWSTRYLQKETAWDAGTISPPLKQYLDQIENKKLRILIPGAGNAYEAGYAFKNGFSDIHILDNSALPLLDFQNDFPDFPKSQIHHQDFFLHEDKYDLILEQTFFCAQPPEMRQQYAAKMFDLLKPGGKLAGVLFNKIFEHEEPPFGGSVKEYQVIFQKKFKVLKLEKCNNSFPQRMGNEVFVWLQKPNI